MSSFKKIAVIPGDGIGPEIVNSALKILQAAGARITCEFVEMGEKVYLRGVKSGIRSSTISTLKTFDAILKGPVTKPLGTGYCHINLLLQKQLGFFANVRPLYTHSNLNHTNPYSGISSNVANLRPAIDLIFITESSEDLYSGLEYQHGDIAKGLKIVSYEAAYRIIQYAFAQAQKLKRYKVTCIAQDNVLKITDGLFHKIFTEVASRYNHIQSEYLLADEGIARLAKNPESFGVIVTQSLYGDMLSNMATELHDSKILAALGHIGTNQAMFEAVHGSAADIAGQNLANPSGIINASIMMLEYLGQGSVAKNIKNALQYAITAGVHTKDCYNPPHSKRLATTAEFTQTVISYLSSSNNITQGLNISQDYNNNLNMLAFEDSLNQSKSIDLPENVLAGVDIYIARNSSPVYSIPTEIASQAARMFKGWNLLSLSSIGSILSKNENIDELKEETKQDQDITNVIMQIGQVVENTPMLMARFHYTLDTPSQVHVLQLLYALTSYSICFESVEKLYITSDLKTCFFVPQ